MNSTARALGSRTPLVLALLLAVVCGAAHAQEDTPVIARDSLPERLRTGDPAALSRVDTRGHPLGDDLRARVHLSPETARVGEAITYRGAVLVDRDTKVRFEPPASAGAFTWTHVRAGRDKPGWFRETPDRLDNVWIEARLQVFEVGRHTIEGPVVRVDRTPRSSRPTSMRLPSVRVTILPTVTSADSANGLRALHGPVAAPWWERLPWTAIIVGLLLVAGATLWWRLRARRKPADVPKNVPRPATARPRMDPATEALRALAALRKRELPVAGQFSEHAFELTAILRRFLEATVATPRPGDTSGELLDRLRGSRMPGDDYERLEGLLLLWDRVKFARAPLTELEATRCEEAVEGYVRRTAQTRLDAARVATAPQPPPGGAPPVGPVPPTPEAA
jgi:hypothetical protein